MVTHMLCSNEHGGEHFQVRATDSQLLELGIRNCADMCWGGPTYDDGLPTWQGSLRAINRAVELYGVSE